MTWDNNPEKRGTYLKTLSGVLFLFLFLGVTPLYSEPIIPIPEIPHLPPGKVSLGKRLFFEKKLSRYGDIACSSCHDLTRGGVDGMVYSIGSAGKFGTINTPTVLNAAFNFRQFWNGRADTLEMQIDGSLLSDREMANTWQQVVKILSADDSYVKAFSAEYADGLTPVNIKDAIATFERTLITPHARFDKFLRGEKDALSAYELKGYQLFTDFGCISCHQGINIGGSMFQKFGVKEDYFKGKTITEADIGRFASTHDEADRYQFKVPSLRNVELTSPYFHDGSAATLKDAVMIMARVQLGKKLTNEERDCLVAFLKTLTGDQPLSSQ